MKRTRIRTIVVISTIAAVMFLGGREFLLGPRSRFAGFDRGMQKAYATIRIGDDKSNLLAAFGQPHRVAPTFCLPQPQGFEQLYEEARRSASVEYYLWINGMNWYYCIGFDSNGKVAMKGEGNS